MNELHTATADFQQEWDRKYAQRKFKGIIKKDVINLMGNFFWIEIVLALEIPTVNR